jgi:iron complex outermembrane receptor protein
MTNKKSAVLTPAAMLLLHPMFASQALAAENNEEKSDTLVVMAQPTGLTQLGSPVSVSVIDGQDLRNAAPQINLSENLGSVPGLQLQNRQNYAQDLQLSIRGFGSRSMFGVRGVRMYVDGIPATMPDGQGQTSNIDINSVERIEVLRGPYSALYGNASGGVINVDTQTGRQRWRPAAISAATIPGAMG